MSGDLSSQWWNKKSLRVDNFLAPVGCETVSLAVSPGSSTRRSDTLVIVFAATVVFYALDRWTILFESYVYTFRDEVNISQPWESQLSYCKNWWLKNDYRRWISNCHSRYFRIYLSVIFYRLDVVMVAYSWGTLNNFK